MHYIPQNHIRVFFNIMIDLVASTYIAYQPPKMWYFVPAVIPYINSYIYLSSEVGNNASILIPSIKYELLLVSNFLLV
jgi:hypothetical protein